MSVDVRVSIDLSRIRQNAETIKEQTGVPLIAVVKADAYGLGAGKVAETIGDLVNAFYVFDAAEAVAARLWDIAGRRTIALNSSWTDPAEFLSRRIQPVVWSVDRARQLAKAQPVLSIDTGQQRFACPADQAELIFRAGDCDEVMTHATNLPQVQKLVDAVSQWNSKNIFMHAAGSSLLNEPSAWLNAVRPGLALYQGAVTVSARLVDVRDSTGPAGYTGFNAPRFGIVLAGYSNGVRRGPCWVNGKLQRVLEVGMQSSFIEICPGTRVGDEVILLGSESGVQLNDVADAWNCSQPEVLVRITTTGIVKYF